MNKKYKKIVIAPATFKGVLSAAEVAAAVKEGLLKASPDAEIISLPMADGGGGTVDSLASALGGEIIFCEVTGPLREKVNARYAVIENGKTAVIEMSEAAGIRLIEKKKRNPIVSTTAGVGELIRDAIGRRCEKIIVGLGDSATIDLGLGMAKELGYIFRDDRGEIVDPLPGNFLRIARIDKRKVIIDFNSVDFVGFCDVENRLTGPEGAIRVFGPQKGLRSCDLVLAEDAFESVTEIVESGLGLRLRDEPMTGAAGGMGAAVLAFLRGSLVRGAVSVAKMIHLREAVEKSDLVITGEGSFDLKSLNGKVVSEVVKIAKKLDKPVWLVAGRLQGDVNQGIKNFEGVIEVSRDRALSSKETFDKISSLMSLRKKRSTPTVTM